MTPDDLKRLPFGEIAEAFSHSAHSRRMAGTLIALYPNAGRFHVLARACMSPEFVEALGDTENQAVVTELLKAGQLPAKRVREVAEMAPNYKCVADAHAEDADLQENILFALGSPFLGDLAKTLFAQYPSSSILPRTCVRNALLGNPLVHGDSGCPDPNRMVEWRDFLRNAALYGNFKNPHISSILATALDGDGDTLQHGNCSVVMEHLVKRADLSDELAVAFHKSTMGSDQSHHELFRNQTHQKLVKEGNLDGFLLLVGTEQYAVSPAVEPEKFRRVYDEETGPASRRTSLLYAAQCPEAIYLVEKECTDLLADADFLRYSPYAKSYLAEIPRSTFWDTFRSGFLDTQIEYNAGLQSLSFSSIPFDAITPDNLRAAFDGSGKANAAFIIGALSSRAFAESLGPMDGTAQDLARALSPSASGLQLEKFAGLHPEMAALAACHPNGGDVQLRAVTERQIDAVARIRGTVLLPGRARMSSGQDVDSLAI